MKSRSSQIKNTNKYFLKIRNGVKFNKYLKYGYLLVTAYLWCSSQPRWQASFYSLGSSACFIIALNQDPWAGGEADSHQLPPVKWQLEPTFTRWWAAPYVLYRFNSFNAPISPLRLVLLSSPLYRWATEQVNSLWSLSYKVVVLFPTCKVSLGHFFSEGWKTELPKCSGLLLVPP